MKKKKNKTKYKKPGKLFMKQEQGQFKYENKEDEFTDENPVKVISNKKMIDAAFADLYKLMDSRNFTSEDEIAGFMEKFNRGEFAEELLKIKENQSPERKAQDLIYKAFETSSKTKRIKFAKQALNISELCSDAYNILAEDEAISFEEKEKLYQKGIEAGEKYLKLRNKDFPVDDLWADFESRPYLRSLNGLAAIYRDYDCLEESVEIHYHILKLNKTDNQGIRFSLVFSLIALDRIKEANQLLNKYKNDNALESLFAKFVIEALENGYSETTRRYFNRVFDYNTFMLKYLIFEFEKFPKKIPESFGPGDENEAIIAIYNAFPALFQYPKVILIYYLFALQHFLKKLPHNKEIINEIEKIKEKIDDKKLAGNLSLYRNEDFEE